MLPMGHPGKDDLVKIVEDLLKFFTIQWGAGWQLIPDIARTDIRFNRIFLLIIKVFSHPVNQLVSMQPELFVIHRLLYLLMQI